MRPIQVAKTNIEGVAIISTIQLPVELSYSNSFETMIFYTDENQPEYQRHHATLDEALIGHIDAITLTIKEKV